MPDEAQQDARDRWKPVTGPTVEEQGEGYAASFPALYECPKCSAAVPRGSLEKHDTWHATSWNPL